MRITLNQVAPELRPAVQLLPRVPVSSRLGRWLARGAIRLAGRALAYDGVQIEQRSTGGVGLRLYLPATPASGAGLLWLHGGGLVIGSAVQDDAFCAATASQLGLVIVAPDYALAPEAPFPAALNDCRAAWDWLLAAAPRLNLDPARLAVGGQSAGAGLAAALVQQVRDTAGPQPAAQWLFCPMLDDRTALARELDGGQHFVWDNRQNRSGWQAYLGRAFGADPPAYAVPARCRDLRDLPPAWIGVGDIDLFATEAQTYAARLLSAGVACTLDVVAGAPHGFEAIAAHAPLAQAYLARGRDWLRQQLAPD